MCCEDCNKRAKVYYNYCGCKICEKCFERNYEVVDMTAQPKKGKRGQKNGQSKSKHEIQV